MKAQEKLQNDLADRELGLENLSYENATLREKCLELT